MVENKKTILLVEDEAIFALTETFWLQRAGYECIHVLSGEKAIEVVRSKKIDLILMDMDLGDGLSGTETAEIILKDYFLPILFLTSHTEKDVVEQTENITSYGYVIKDVKDTVLLASIKMAFKLHQANQKLIEQRKALQISEEKFAKAFRTSPDAIGITRAKDGVYLEINEGFTELSGYLPEEIIGRSALPGDLNLWVHPEERDLFVKRIFENGKQSLETEFRLKDGRIRLGVIVGNIIELEGEKCVLTIIQDVTEQRKAQEALRSSEERFRGLAGNLPGIVFQTSVKADGTITLDYVSNQAKEIFKLDNNPMETFVDRFFAGLTPEGAENYMLSIKRAIALNSSWEHEGKYVSSDGEIIYFKGLAQHRKVGDEIVYDGILLNVTEQKRTEEALRTSEERFRGIADNLPGIVFEGYARKNGEIGQYYVSGQSKELFGIDIKPDENFFTCFLEGMFPIERQKFLKSVETTIKSFSVWEYDGKYAGHNGKTIFYKGIAQPRYVGDEVIYDGFLLDISKQKETEEALIKSQERFWQVSETACEWIWEVDAEGLYTYSNSVVESILGYKPEEIVGIKHYYDLWSDETKKLLFPKMEIIAANKEIIAKLENAAVHKNGNIVILETSGLPMIDIENDGALLGFRGTDIDITERKRAEQKLRDAEIRYRKLFELSPDGIVIVNTATMGFIDFNETSYKQLGYTKEEFAKLTLADIDINETPDQIKDRIRTILENKYGEFETKHKTRSGEIRNIHVKASVLEVLGDQLYYCVWRDITNQKKAEESLAQERSLMDAIFNSVPGILYLYDKDGRLRRWNKQHEILTGYTSDELSKKTLFDWYKDDEVSAAKIQEGVRKTFDTGYGEASAELQRRDGSKIWMYFTASLLKINGEPFFAGIGINITESKKTEKQLRESQERLQKFMDSATDSFTIWDKNLNLIDLNNVAFEYFLPKSKREEMIGKNFFEYFPHLKNEDRLERFMHVINSGIPYDREEKILLSPQNEVWLDTRVFQVGDGLGLITSNITERKRAESLLKESELKYRSFIQQSYDGFVLTDDKGIVIEWNEAVERLTNIKREEALNANVIDIQLSLADPKLDKTEIRQRLFAMFERASKTGEDEFINKLSDADIFLKNGKKIAIQQIIFLIDTGKGYNFGIIIRDISEKKKAEEALKKSEEYYRSLIENSSDLMVVSDSTGKFKYASPSVFNILGFMPEEFIALDSMKIIHPEDLATRKIREEFDRISQTPGSFTSNFMRILHKNGSWRYLEVLGKSTYDQNGELIVISNLRDITERIKANEELRRYKDHLVEMVEERTSELEQSRETFRALTENTKDVIMRVDENFNFLYMNPAMKSFFKVASDDYLGKSIYELGFYDKGMSGIDELLKKVFETKRSNRLEFQLSNGTWADLLAMPEFDINENVCSIIISARDITELKRLQLSIQDALEKQKELNRLKNRFVSMVSHEYRTPLTSILSSVEILELGDAKYTKEKKQVHFNRIQKNIDYLISMIDEVLYVNKIDSDRIQVAMQSINLKDFCKEIFAEISEQYPLIKSKLKFKLSDENYNTDPAILKKVLGNIVINAYKYNRENGEVLFDVKSGKDKLTFVIKDTGIGIPEEEQKNLFEAFSRMTNAQHIKGTGLGLSIVKKSIEQLNGSISYKSKQNEGTTFTVTIPII